MPSRHRTTTTASLYPTINAVDLASGAGHPPVGTCEGRGRTGARCRDLSWPVSPARPPHRTCESPRIRRSTGSRWLCGSGWDARPGGGDAGAPVEVPCDRHRLRPEHLGVAILYLPAVQETALQRSPAQAPVPFTEPGDYSPPCEVFEVAEGPLGLRPEPAGQRTERAERRRGEARLEHSQQHLQRNR